MKLEDLIAAVAPALLATGFAGCALDFDRFEGSAAPAAPDGGSSDGATDTDAATPQEDAKATDTDAALDAGVAPPSDAQDETGPCTPSTGCLTTARSCDTGCTQQDQSCSSKCTSSTCRSKCDRTAMMCTMQCTDTCSSCTQSAGCSATAACAGAGR